LSQPVKPVNAITSPPATPPVAASPKRRLPTLKTRKAEPPVVEQVIEHVTENLTQHFTTHLTEQVTEQLAEQVIERPAVTIEILRQLGAISSKQEQALTGFGPVKSIQNHQGIVTGQTRPVFEL